MEKKYARTTTLREDKVSGFCPGCMHSTVAKLIGEVLEELNVVDKAVLVAGVGCCGLLMDYVNYDNTTAAHGRACAVATGMKRSNPESIVFTYQGDGDLAAIGLGETMSAANRGENFTVIFVNNGIYGMTGGQMAPTTLGGTMGSDLQTIILASSVLYELIGPGCAKLALYLSKSYSTKLEDVAVVAEVTETGEQKSDVQLLIERIRKIQSELPPLESDVSEEEAAFTEAAEEQLAQTQAQRRYFYLRR